MCISWAREMCLRDLVNPVWARYARPTPRIRCYSVRVRRPLGKQSEKFLDGLYPFLFRSPRKHYLVQRRIAGNEQKAGQKLYIFSFHICFSE
jgi:hypothetical protein